MTGRFRWRGALGAEARAALLDRSRQLDADVERRVRSIGAAVRSEGDAALQRLTKELDGVEITDPHVAASALEQAVASVDNAIIAALGTAIEQVRAYHEATAPAPRSERFEREGVVAWERHVPLARVGIYVPGGRAAYPSSLVMAAVPAMVAGVDGIVVASPPGDDGRPDPLVLAACHLLGIDQVLSVGGAQAIFALAEGTGSIEPCQAVVGPGNAYVEAAKRAVAGRVRIDAPAGPSEVAVLVADAGHAERAARELVAQAEHDPATLAVALCVGDDTADAVDSALEDALAKADRTDTVAAALKARGALFTVDDVGEAAAFINELAPEHAVVLGGEADVAERLTGPACVVVGPDACVPLADYAAGPSHVLPTGGAARAWSGIGVHTFMRAVHIVEMDGVSARLRDAAATLARAEGLTGHATALEAME